MTTLNVRDVIALYLRHSQAKRLHCAASFVERARTLNDFSARFGDMPVSDCLPFHLSDWIEERTSWRSVSTRRAKANQVRACFEWCRKSKRIPENPFEFVTYPEAERRPDLGDGDFARFSCLANKPYERALKWLRLTGCRLSEMCRARWEDIDFGSLKWIVDKHKGRHLTKRAKIIALIPAAMQLLASIKEQMARTGAEVPAAGDPASKAGTIFRNTKDTPWNRITMGQQFRRMKIRFKIDTKASLHGIRHRFGTASIANGGKLKALSLQLGHASTAITERYYIAVNDEFADLMREAALKANM